MALTLATGTAQTTVGASLTPLFLPSASYPVSRDVAGETILQNTATTLDQPNSVRFAVSSIADIFKSASIEPVSGQSIAGLSMLCQLNEIWKVDDAADALAPIYYPVSAHMVVKLPMDALVTSTVAADLVRRLIGAVLRDNSQTLATGWNNLIHGITKF